ADEEDVAPSVAPPVPVRDGKARQSSVGLAAHPIGRLVARVVLRAGAAVEEAVVESDVFDLSTGTRCSSPPSPLAPGARGGGGAPAPGQGDCASAPARRGWRARAACGVGASIDAWPPRPARGSAAARGNRGVGGGVPALRPRAHGARRVQARGGALRL